MKAVIMAGGEGSRLRPISDKMPKPMVPILGAPVLERTLRLLRNAGITSACITLKYMPEVITGYFGDGSRFGMSLSYRTEERPMGTAGGVKACSDFTNGEDFLVISGDAVCDFDLSALISSHRRDSMVTMALYPHSDPLRYGLVLTSRSGEVVSFIEKPSWGRVVTDLVNTGIYIMTPRAMSLVPEGKAFDFAKELFPEIMRTGGTIRGITMDGYWCDIGDPDSYYRCCSDALSGKLKIDIATCPSLDLQGSIIQQPCYIGKNVSIGERCSIGPGCSIEDGSIIGPGSIITRSMVLGANLEGECTVTDSVICRGSFVSSGSRIAPGSVISRAGSAQAPRKEIASPARKRAEGVYIEVPCRSRARLMRALAEAAMEAGADFSDGISLSSRGEQIRIFPAEDRSSVIIQAEKGSGSHARSICKKYADMAKEFYSYE